MAFVYFLITTTALGAAFALYWAPTLVAYCGKSRRLSQIAVINGFLGWTLVGWVASLVIALEKEKA